MRSGEPYPDSGYALHGTIHGARLRHSMEKKDGDQTIWKEHRSAHPAEVHGRQATRNEEKLVATVS